MKPQFNHRTLRNALGLSLAALAIYACVGTEEEFASSSSNIETEANIFLGYIEIEGDPIAKIHVTDETVCLGDSFVVSVDFPEPNNDTAVFIAGTPGARRLIQAFPLGQYNIPITVRSPQGIGSEMVSIEVKDCETMRPRIMSSISRLDSREMHFTITNLADLVDADLVYGYTWKVRDANNPDTILASGSSEYPTWTHRIDPDHINYDEHFTPFIISVEVRAKTGTYESARSFTIRPTYAMTLARGYVQPPVSFDPLRWSDGMTIHNVDDNEALKFDGAEYTFWRCTESATEVVPETVTLPSVPEIYVAPGESVTVPFEEIFGEREKDWGDVWRVCGLGVRLTGALNNTPAEANAYVELRQFPGRVRRVHDQSILNMLNQATDRGLWPENDPEITQRELWRLEREGRLEVVPGGFNEPPANSDTPTVSLIDGELRCDPTDNDTERPPGFEDYTCQPTGEFEQSVAYIGNAHAGDMPLSSGCGRIGILLRQLSPAQRFSHVGIFTDAQDNIRHSTAAQPRILKERAWYSSVLDARRLTYPQPGVLTQSVVEAYDGGRWQDWEHPGESYVLHSFNDEMNQCDGDGDPTFPTLLRWSHDQADAANVEEIVRRVELMAGHYRFFSYSNGAIGSDPAYDDPNPPVVGADGRNRATVCSSLIWTAASEAGLTLESGCEDPAGCVNGLESWDRRGCEEDVWGLSCAEIDSQTADGLYYYTAEERLAAGRAIYQSSYRQAAEDADIPVPWQFNQVSNQVANCFALDKCDASGILGEDYGRGRWSQNVQPGHAISPDDLLFWDAPYSGHTEPIAERQGTYRRIYAWQPPNSCNTPACQGTVRAVVRDENGALLEDVTVDIHQPGNGLSNIVGRTGPAGEMVFTEVPEGTYEITASAYRGDNFYQDSELVTVTSGNESVVEFVLDNAVPANVDNQQGNLHVIADISVYDADWSPRLSESGSTILEADLALSGTNPQASETLAFCVDNEVELRIIIEARYDAGQAKVGFIAQIYEGTHCGDDHMGEKLTGEITMPSGSGHLWRDVIVADEWGLQDSSAEFEITASYELN